MVAGTKQIDAGDGENSGICPLVELQEKYNNISDSVSKIIARRANTDHGGDAALCRRIYDGVVYVSFAGR